MNFSANRIRLFNTLTRKKELFTPLVDGKVRMYTCGPTVYDFAHIGNFRAFIFEDLLKRWLEHSGFQVTHVMNITDVDDKTIKKSREKQMPLQQYTKYYAKAFFEDVATLNIKKADYYPKATESIPEMVALIKKLVDKGIAYTGDDGSVYYDISKFKSYGQLSKINMQKLKVGARVRMDDYSKEEAQDFALWKAWTKEDSTVFWDTDLGRGRPGWHIECSAMSMKYLGQTFDIHCGGVDNIFPHHENEIAQSEAGTGKPFVNYWLHNEFLLVEGKKMAKSRGNYYTLRDLLKMGYDPMAIRYLLMSTHYRQQFNFTFEGLAAAKGAITRITNFTRRLLDENGEGAGEKIIQLVEKVQTNFGEALNDDLNINLALATLFDFLREINNLIDTNGLSANEAKKVYELMISFDKVLGVIGEVKKKTLSEEAKQLIEKREAARKAKDWKTADALRKKLKSLGVEIEDTPQGVRWRIENT